MPTQAVQTDPLRELVRGRAARPDLSVPERVRGALAASVALGTGHCTQWQLSLKNRNASAGPYVSAAEHHWHDGPSVVCLAEPASGPGPGPAAALSGTLRDQ